MKKFILSLSFACIATQALAVTDFGRDGGRPITSNDIAGKTICWSNGWVRANFAANGVYTDNRHHPGKWYVPEPGVLKVGNWIRSTEILPDGRLHVYKFCIYCDNRDIESWGTKC